jgi:hypothetical protein
MLSKNYVTLFAILGVAVVIVLIAPMVAQTMGLAMGIASVTPVLAQTVNTNGNTPAGDFHRGGIGWGSKNRIQSGVFGTVSAISGNVITVTSKFKPKRNGTATTTAYTVEAGNATVTKNGSSSSVSNIAVGDMIMVQGTVSGNQVIAKTIRDNTPGQQKGFGVKGSMSPLIKGNGQPIVSGSVTAISGTTVTITNKSNVTYTIDASNATIQNGNTTSTLSSVVTGDNVIVQGTVNGTSVTASSIIVQGMSANSNTSSTEPLKPHPGFLGGIFGFFQHIFGF